VIDEVTFSERGGRITPFEARLITQSKSESPWLCVARRLILGFGVEIGAQAFVVVLDELGGEKLHVSTRRHFFEALWRTERDALIRDLASRRDDEGNQEWSFADIGRALGVSREYARKTAARQPQRTPTQRAT